ncbi:MAG TPA: flagellar filament capping protein FliD [Polyangia bacterium]|jgi:flagellar hook-associated protein 2
MADSPSFTASGLASGLDTNSIIDGLTQIASQPLTDLRTQQTGFKTQVSLIGSLVSQIGTFYAAAKALGTNGALGITTTSNNVDFTATPAANASPSSHTISVQNLATAAQQRSTAFSDSSSPVRGGTLEVKVQGTSYGTITIGDGESLQDVASDLQTLGAPINVSVLTTGTGSTYLSVTNKDTGYTTGAASGALQLNEVTDPLATQGKALGFTSSHTATNAEFTVDNLAFVRQSNTVTDVIDGTTLALRGKSNTDEQMTTDVDTTATASNLQKFVDAYNALITTVAKDQTIPDGSTRDATLSGDSTARDLVSSLQSIMTNTVSGLGGVRTLADLGLKTNFQDGTLSIDTTKLATAISIDPTAVNKIFNDPLTGISAQAFDLSEKFTSVVDGVFTTRTNGLNDQIKQMDTDAESLQERIDSYKANLQTQFTAMEELVSGFKATGNFLTQQEAQPK